jgi:excinuclease UvrABC helicase subunit UvrB
MPARTSIAGSKTATAEVTSEVLARTEVIGRDALNKGFSSVLGEESFPPRAKKQRADAVKEKGKTLSAADRRKLIEQLTAEMRDAAKHLEFEKAAFLRDKIKELRET